MIEEIRRLVRDELAGILQLKESLDAAVKASSDERQRLFDEITDLKRRIARLEKRK